MTMEQPLPRRGLDVPTARCSASPVSTVDVAERHPAELWRASTGTESSVISWNPAIHPSIPHLDTGSSTGSRKRRSLFARPTSTSAPSSSRPAQTSHLAESSRAQSRSPSPRRTGPSSSADVPKKRSEALDSIRNSIFGGKKRPGSRTSTHDGFSRMVRKPSRSSLFRIDDAVQMQEESSSDQTGQSHIKKASISSPFNFQHVAHSERKHPSTLDTVDEKDLPAQVWTMSGREAHRRQLIGARPESVANKLTTRPLSRNESPSRPASALALGSRRPAPNQLPPDRIRPSSQLEGTVRKRVAFPGDVGGSHFKPHVLGSAPGSPPQSHQFPQRQSSLTAFGRPDPTQRQEPDGMVSPRFMRSPTPIQKPQDVVADRLAVVNESDNEDACSRMSMQSNIPEYYTSPLPPSPPMSPQTSEHRLSRTSLLPTEKPLPPTPTPHQMSDKRLSRTSMHSEEKAVPAPASTPRQSVDKRHGRTSLQSVETARSPPTPSHTSNMRLSRLSLRSLEKAFPSPPSQTSDRRHSRASVLSSDRATKNDVPSPATRPQLRPRRSSESFRFSTVGMTSTPDLHHSSALYDMTWEEDIDFAYEQEMESTCDFDWNSTPPAIGPQMFQKAGRGLRRSIVIPGTTFPPDSKEPLMLHHQSSVQSLGGFSVSNGPRPTLHRSRPSVGHRGFVEARRMSSVEGLSKLNLATSPVFEVFVQETDGPLLSPVFVGMNGIEEERVERVDTPAQKRPDTEDGLSDPESIRTGGSKHRKSSSCGSYESRPLSSNKSDLSMASSKSSTPDLLRPSQQKHTIKRKPLNEKGRSPTPSVPRLGQQHDLGQRPPVGTPASPIVPARKAFVMRRPETRGERAVLQAAGVAARRQPRRGNTPPDSGVPQIPMDVIRPRAESPTFLPKPGAGWF